MQLLLCETRSNQTQIMICNLNLKIFFSILISLECFWHSSTLTPLPRENDPRPFCSCSNDQNSLNTRIVGGHEAARGQFPYATELLPNFSLYSFQQLPEIRGYCGATLITDRHVITAAHCIRNRNIGQIILDIGDYNISSPIGKKIQRRPIKLTKHPQYIPKSFNNDIGIIEFDRPITFDDDLETAWLPAPNSDLITGTTVTVYGWGRLDYKGSSPNILHTVDLPVVDRNTCQNVYVSRITSNMICAGGQDHQDACIGDSGSGLTTQIDNDYALVGVVSFGKRCGLQYVPGIYTKVSNYVEWIYEETKNATCQPCIASPDN